MTVTEAPVVGRSEPMSRTPSDNLLKILFIQGAEGGKFIGFRYVERQDSSSSDSRYRHR